MATLLIDECNVGFASPPDQQTIVIRVSEIPGFPPGLDLMLNFGEMTTEALYKYLQEMKGHSGKLHVATAVDQRREETHASRFTPDKGT